MPDTDRIRTVLERFQEMQGRRASWEPAWQDLLDYVLPSRAPVNGSGTPGEQRTERQFDGAPTRFMRRLASWLMGQMTSPAERWFALVAKGIEDDQVDAWLDASADDLYAALHASNFYAEIAEAYADLITLGTCGLFVDERPLTGPGFNGLVFRTLAPGEYWLDENAQGEVDTVFRRLMLTPRQAALKFGKEKLHSSVQDELKGEGAQSESLYLHAVHRRDDPQLGGKTRAGDRSSGNSPWVSVYLDHGNEHVVASGGFRDQRLFAPRWSKASGELYGRGPAMEALPDIKTLNTLVRYGLEGLILSVYPPWLFPDESLIGRLRLTPGAHNVYDPETGGEIRALQGRGDFRVEVAKEQELRQAIAQAFLDDVLGAREQGAVTATEILDRRERRQHLTGPAVARIQSELLDPLVSTAWLMMFRAGAFGPPPAALMAAERIEVDYLSPLARAQKMARVRSMQDAFALLQPLAQASPGMLDHYDFDAIAREVPADVGVPRTWLRNPEQVAAARQARAAAQQRRQALNDGQEIARTAASVGAADGE